MADIIYGENRFPKVGEVCALDLTSLGYHNLDERETNEVCFHLVNYGKVKGITLVKYLGYGLFMDLVSDQVFRLMAYNDDDIGTEQLYKLQLGDRKELEKIADSYGKDTSPKDITDFKIVFNMFLTNPLAFDIVPNFDNPDLVRTPLMSIDSEIVRKFASQPLDKIKGDILSLKEEGIRELGKTYTEMHDFIQNYYAMQNNKSL